VTGDINTLADLAQATAPLVPAVSMAPLMCLSDSSGEFNLATGWTSSPLASVVPLDSQQQQMDQLIAKNLPPPPAPGALSDDQVIQLFIQAATGSTSDLTAALQELEKLSWESRFSVLEQLSTKGPTLDGKTYLELIEDAVAQLPNANATMQAAMIVVLMNHGGRTLGSIDMAVNFTQALITLDERDQWQLLAKLGLHANQIEGTMAIAAGEAVAAGLLQLPSQLANIFINSQSTTPIGKWRPPGDMPGSWYIGLSAHVAIAAEYRAANSVGHTIFTNTTPVDSILTQLQGLLMFKGSRVAVALGLSKPDIFDFSLEHPVMPPGWVYEIKPWNSLATAEFEALFYTDALLLAGIPSMPGLTGAPGTTGCLPAPGGWFIFAALLPGAIVYWYRKATNAELQAQGLSPADDPVADKTAAALKAAGATAAVAGAVAVIAVILEALKDAGWIIVFL
jgi:hypothetical protein